MQAPVILLRESEVVARVGFSRTTLWRKVKAGEFPKPVKPSTNVTRWRDNEVSAFIAAL